MVTEVIEDTEREIEAGNQVVMGSSQKISFRLVLEFATYPAMA